MLLPVINSLWLIFIYITCCSCEIEEFKRFACLDDKPARRGCSSEPGIAVLMVEGHQLSN